MTIYQVAIVSLSPQKSAKPLYWYYWQKETQTYKDGNMSSGMTYMQSCMKSRQLVQKLLGEKHIMILLICLY